MSSPSRKRNSKPASPVKSTPTKRRSKESQTNTTDELNRKTPRTPPRRSPSSTTAGGSISKVVTPSVRSPTGKKRHDNKDEEGVVARKKLPFGLTKKPIDIPPNVQRVYHIVHKHSGSLGGNGHGGAIYGELTTGSMQKMTNLMIEHTGLSKSSRFIDVGCGLGKPNLHVAQCPGVEFSYGIEMEHVRWMIGMTNLEHVLKAAKKDEEDDIDVEDDATIKHSCYFSHGDITEANFFDPFTHVYMFDIG